MSGSPEFRVSDADREQVATRLRTAYSEGRLDEHELDERLAVVYRAKVGSELADVERDLPSAIPVEPQEPTSSTLSNVTSMARPLAVAPVICTIIWALTTPGGYFWPMWVWFGCMVPVIVALVAGLLDGD